MEAEGEGEGEEEEVDEEAMIGVVRRGAEVSTTADTAE